MFYCKVHSLDVQKLADIGKTLTLSVFSDKFSWEVSWYKQIIADLSIVISKSEKVMKLNNILGSDKFGVDFSFCWINLVVSWYSLEQYIGFVVRQAFNYCCSLHQVWRDANN